MTKSILNSTTLSNKISQYRAPLLLTILLAVIYFPIFLHLTYMPFRIWDESIMGVNAIEMLHNHNYLVTYFYGKPDMSNCKPPFMIWCIVLFSKLIGFSELSVRLPSALAALALCIYLFFILKKCVGSYMYGFITVIVLVTCQGYIRNHVTRTGEYDSLLVLFSTVFALSLYIAINAEDKKEQSKYLLLFFVFLTFAVLTKGIAPIMQAPGLFIYALARKKVIPFLKTKAFYLGLLFFVVFGLGYYALRETVNPGYLLAVWNNELGGRFGGTVEGHKGAIWFYLNEIVTWQFTSYLVFFPVALLSGVMIQQQALRRLVVFAAWAGLSFFFFISVAGTKLPHYDAPLFPYLAIITASLFYSFYLFMLKQASARYSWLTATGISFLLVLLFFVQPYTTILSKVYFPKGDPWEEGFSISCRYFQSAAHNKQDNSAYKIVSDAKPDYGCGTVISCYKEELDELGVNPIIVKHDQLATGDSAVIFDPYLLQLINEHFETKAIAHLDICNADLVSIGAKKGI